MGNVMKTAFTGGKTSADIPAYSEPKKSGQSSGEVRHKVNKNKIENMEHMPKGKKGY